jgi:hypothetical protein
VVGGSTLPLGATARPGRCGSGIGRQRYRLAGPGGTIHAGAGPGDSARVVPPALPAAGQAVVTRCLLIGPFEFKFECLNMNSTV